MWQRRDAAPFGDPAAIVAVACAFADGDLDVLSGRFVHATKDEVVDLAARGGEIVASDARRRLRLGRLRQRRPADSLTVVYAAAHHGVPRSVCCLVIGALFLVAGVSKLRDPAEVRASVAAYQVLPAALVTPTARLLPIVEVAVGAPAAAGRAHRPRRAGRSRRARRVRRGHLGQRPA
jgi:hypothetical protein